LKKREDDNCILFMVQWNKNNKELHTAN